MFFCFKVLMKSKIKRLLIPNMVWQGKKTGLTRKAERFRLALRRDWMICQNPFYNFIEYYCPIMFMISLACLEQQQADLTGISMMPNVNQGTPILGQALNQVLFLSFSICSSNQCLDSDVMSFCYVSSSQYGLWHNVDHLKIGPLRSQI